MSWGDEAVRWAARIIAFRGRVRADVLGESCHGRGIEGRESAACWCADKDHDTDVEDHRSHGQVRVDGRGGVSPRTWLSGGKQGERRGKASSAERRGAGSAAMHRGRKTLVPRRREGLLHMSGKNDGAY